MLTAFEALAFGHVLPCSLLAVADFKLSCVLRTQEGESVPFCSQPSVNTACGPWQTMRPLRAFLVVGSP